MISGLWKVLRHPVSGAIELATDPRWRGHTAFFVFALALAGLQSKLPQRNDALPELMRNEPSPPGLPYGKNYDYIKENLNTEIEVFSLYGTFVLIALSSYWLFKYKPGRQRSLREYVKLSCIWLAITGLRAMSYSVPTSLAAMKVISNNSSALVVGWVLLAGLTAVLLYSFLIVKYFWDVSWIRAILTMIISVFCSTILIIFFS